MEDRFVACVSCRRVACSPIDDPSWQNSSGQGFQCRYTSNHNADIDFHGAPHKGERGIPSEVAGVPLIVPRFCLVRLGGTKGSSLCIL
jgi:hypothetical protein